MKRILFFWACLLFSCTGRANEASEFLKPLIGQLFDHQKKSELVDLKLGLILNVDLYRDVERKNPGFWNLLSEIRKSEHSLSSSQVDVVWQKVNQSLLAIGLSYILDQEAMNHKLPLTPSSARLEYAVETVLWQILTEGPLKLPMQKVQELSLSQMFSLLKESETLWLNEARAQGQAYVQIKVDQDWKYASLGSFRESDPTQKPYASFWPALSLEFRSTLSQSEDGQNAEWTSFFPDSLLDLRELLKKQLSSAIREVVRREIFYSLLAQRFPNLKQASRFHSRQEMMNLYEKVKFDYFKEKEVLAKVIRLQWDPEKLKTSNLNLSESDAEKNVMTLFFRLLSTKQRHGDFSGNKEDQAVLDVVNSLDLQKTVTISTDFHEFHGEGGKSIAENAIINMKDFAIRSLSLTCLGSLMGLPCYRAKPGEIWILSRREIRSKDSYLDFANDGVQAQLNALLYDQAIKKAHHELIESLLSRVEMHWIGSDLFSLPSEMGLKRRKIPANNMAAYWTKTGAEVELSIEDAIRAPSLY